MVAKIPFTKKKQEILRRLYPIMYRDEVAAELKVSEPLVARWARELGLKRNRKGIKKRFRTEEHKLRIAEALLGHVISKKTRKKIGKANSGRKLTEETKKKIRDTKKRNNSVPKGDKHYNWKGGKPWERFATPEYQEWRNKVLKRDYHTCQHCGETHAKIDAHHIKSYKDYPKLRYKVSNGLTLCRACHWKVHGKKLPEIKKIKCACGCGQELNSFDIHGRPRKYINFHGARGKPKPESMKRQLSEARKGVPKTKEQKEAIKRGLANSSKPIGRPKGS